MLATYTDLQAAVIAWANRTDIAARVPDFIALAEARMSADLSTKALERVQSVPIVGGIAALPVDVVETLSLRIVGASYPTVEVTSREAVQSLASQGYAGGTTYAAFVGRDVWLSASTGQLEVTAKCRVPPLASNATNWVLTNYPNAYLFGALQEAAWFLRDPTLMAQWENRYAEAVDQANRALIYRGQASASRVRGVR